MPAKDLSLSIHSWTERPVIKGSMVTAGPEPLEKPGSRIGVTISSIGDATSVQGGIPAVNTTNCPDANVYALSQGALVVGGFAAVNATTWVTVNHPTVGRVPNAPNVERAVVAGMPQTVDILEVETARADFTTTKCAADALSSTLVDRLQIRLVV